MPDLSGRAAIVTGANSGMGFEVARALAGRGCSVVLACRSESRGRTAAASIRQASPAAQVETLQLNLGDLAGIRCFAERFKERYACLDLLINNAGVLLAPYAKTQDGFEMHFGVNHLGHFALTGLLMDRLLVAEEARIVTVSSKAHTMGRICLSDLMFSDGKKYSAFRAYANSKLANLLFCYELQRRLEGWRAISVAAHPGGAATDLGRHMSDCSMYRRMLPLLQWLSQSANEAARSVLRAAAAPDVVGGEYYGPGGVFGMRGAPVRRRSSLRSYDLDVARKLWDTSQALTGVQYP